ncbi:MAG TPA: zf-HC2 domain-containing protein [Gemmatimonadaceae bacterium]|nr:zf-HC2 domain-containing protein [Gemmatimonadaceae bacterium]
MTMRCADCLPMIDALVDHELPPEEERELRAHIERCVDCARELALVVDVSRAAREGLVRHQAPDVLKARIRAAVSGATGASGANESAGEEPVARSRRRTYIRLAAAGVLIAAASSALTFAALRHGATESTESELLASHIRSLMPGHLTDVASTNQHQVKPWFNGRLDLSPTVPNLDSLGFPLLGGRLDYVAGRRVAAVVYGRRQHVINVYSWPATSHESPRAAAAQGYNMEEWQAGNIEYWAVSDLNRPELDEFITRFRDVSGR